MRCDPPIGIHLHGIVLDDRALVTARLLYADEDSTFIQTMPKPGALLLSQPTPFRWQNAGPAIKSIAKHDLSAQQSGN